MSAIINYLINMLPYIIISAPIFVIVRFITYKKTKKLNWYREIAMLIFVMFLIGLGSQTIIPKLEFGINGELSIVNFGIGGINLIPFKVILDTYREVFINGNINYFIINFLGNIIMFMPIGFLLSLLWKMKSQKIILTGFLISFFIEFCQLFIARETDIDDLMLNTFGTILGLIIYKILSKKFDKLFTKFRIDK